MRRVPEIIYFDHISVENSFQLRKKLYRYFNMFR